MPIISQVAPDVAFVPLELLLREAIAFSAALGVEGEEYTLHLFKDGEVDATTITEAAAYEAAECDYTGYAAKTLVDVAPEPFQDEVDGSYLVVVPSQQFDHGAVGVANDVGGWYLLDNNGQVVLAGNFTEPVTMADTLDAIILTVARRFGP